MSENTNEVPKNPGEYSASKITVLEGLEAVRVRPSMYIGDTGQRGLHHLVYEVVDNSIDEALAGYASKVKVTIHPDNSISVEDDGRGIPVDMHPTENKPAVEVVLTVLHAGGKFDHNSYKVSGGLHGVGVSCVNALSDWMNVEVYRNGRIHTISFSRGVTVKQLEEKGATTKRGTKVSFKPDGTIFPDTVYVWDILAKRLRELAFLNSGIHIALTDEREVVDGAVKSEEFHYEGGIREFVAILNTNREIINPEVIYFHRERSGIDVEVAMQYTEHNTQENIHTYTNNINTIEGGTHLVGFQAGLTRTINNYIKNNIKNPPTLSGKDIREGLAAVISVKVPDPQFEGQTKTKLGNSEVRGIVESVINEELATYLEENPEIAKRIIATAMLAFQANEAARKARENIRKTSSVESIGLPGKLSDCSSKDPAVRELYIVEGDSAGGSAKSGRDSKFQAILPIRGKLLNVEKVRIDRIFDNKEIQSLFYAIGCGCGEDFDVTKARYHRVVIMTDADVDGSHIRTLLLTFFFRQMRPLLEAGYVYIAKPPLYKVTKGSKSSYIDTEDQLNRYLVELGLDEMQVKDNSSGEIIPTGDVSKLIALYNRATQISNGLQRVGVDTAEYFSMVREDGLCPIAHITVREYDGTSTSRYVYSADEQYAYTTETEARLREGKDVDDESIANRIDTVTIFEAQNCEALVADLKAEGLAPAQVFTPGETLYLVSPQGKDVDPQEAKCLKDLFSMIRNSGQSGSGLRINRYKGLGEMNASQLWETTMDPNTRTMIRVTMEDAIRADQIFNLLMGDVVEPRREYIEKYAANVKDLDI